MSISQSCDSPIQHQTEKNTRRVTALLLPTIETPTRLQCSRYSLPIHPEQMSQLTSRTIIWNLRCFIEQSHINSAATTLPWFLADFSLSPFRSLSRSYCARNSGIARTVKFTSPPWRSRTGLSTVRGINMCCHAIFHPPRLTRRSSGSAFGGPLTLSVRRLIAVYFFGA